MATTGTDSATALRRSDQKAASRRSPLLLLVVSGSLLLGALGFQHVGGLAPCEMCYWQRYAHMAVLLLASLALGIRNSWLAGLAILAMLASAGLGGFHAGVEQGWWDGPTACASGMAPGMSEEDILGSLMRAPLVRCDAIAWQLAGLSMAGWNGLLSLLAAIGGWMLWRRT